MEEGGDPYFMLMNNALEYDLYNKSEDEISAFLNQIPVGHIVAFDSSDRTRNAYVFVSCGDGQAIEFDAEEKGYISMMEILKRYRGIQKIYYCRPPWLNNISNFTAERDHGLDLVSP